MDDKKFNEYKKKHTVVTKNLKVGLITGCALLGAGAITTGTLYGVSIANKGNTPTPEPTPVVTYKHLAVDTKNACTVFSFGEKLTKEEIKEGLVVTSFNGIEEKAKVLKDDQYDVDLIDTTTAGEKIVTITSKDDQTLKTTYKVNVLTAEEVTQKQWIDAINYLKNRTEERNYTINTKTALGSNLTTLQVDGLNSKIADKTADDEELYEQVTSTGATLKIRQSILKSKNQIVDLVISDGDSLPVQGTDNGEMTAFYSTFSFGSNTWSFDKDLKAYVNGENMIKFNNDHKIVEAKNKNYSYSIDYTECQLTPVTYTNEVDGTIGEKGGEPQYTFGWHMFEIEEMSYNEWEIIIDETCAYCHFDLSAQPIRKGVDWSIMFNTENSKAGVMTAGTIKYSLNNGQDVGKFTLGYDGGAQREFYILDITNLKEDVTSFDVFMDGAAGIEHMSHRGVYSPEVEIRVNFG